MEISLNLIELKWKLLSLGYVMFRDEDNFALKIHMFRNKSLFLREATYYEINYVIIIIHFLAAVQHGKARDFMEQDLDVEATEDNHRYFLLSLSSFIHPDVIQEMFG